MGAKSTRDKVDGLGPRLRALRGDDTLATVAAAAGTSVAALSDVERERRSPSARLLVALARALEVEVGDLLPDPPRRTATGKARLRAATREGGEA